MLKEWVMEHPEAAAEVCPAQALSAQHPPDPLLHVKVHSAHLPPGLPHQTHLPGLLMEDIRDQMIAVIAERQVPSKGIGKRPLIGPMQVTQPGRILEMPTDRILRMREKEPRTLKTVTEKEPILTTATEILI